MNKKVEVDKEIFDLARKLDFIGINSEDRRKIIEQCIVVENKTTYRIISLKKQINKSSQEIKKAIEDFENEYNSSVIEKDYIQLK